MRQVITEREEVHRMSSKNKTEVLIDGKIYTLSGYESEEYLQRVATYINNKLAELKKLDGYARLSQELKSILLELNVADDYFKAKNQVEMVEEELAQKDQELYDLKHELISTQIKLEDAESIAVKLNMMATKNIGGVAVWRLGYGTQAAWELINAYLQ